MKQDLNLNKKIFTWAVLILGLSLSVQAKAPASPDPLAGLFGVPGDSADLQTTLLPADRSADPDLVETRLRSAWIVSESGDQTWTVNQSATHLRLSRPIQLHGTGLKVPDSLWDVSAGVGTRKILGDRKEWSVSGGIGSASDDVFHSRRETTLRATGVYRVPSKTYNSWLFFLAYSNNRHFLNNIPLPGAGYMLHSADHRLDAIVGFPFMFFNFRATPRTALRLMVFGPSNISAEWSNRVAGPVQVYAGFDWNQKEWMRADRADRDDRIFYEQKRWLAGLRAPLSKSVRVDVGGGFAFHRRFYEHDSSTSDPVPEAALGSTWFLQLKGSLKWGETGGRP